MGRYMSVHYAYKQCNVAWIIPHLNSLALNKQGGVLKRRS